MLFRGLKLSTYFLLLPSHKRLEITHERERANNPILLRTDFLIVSVSTIRMSIDKIRKPADTIKRMTGRAGAADDRKRLFSSEKNRKTDFLRFLVDFLSLIF